MCRHYALLGTTSDISPIHWQYGAIARLKKGEKIDRLLYGDYSTISLGYVGICELTKLIKGVSYTATEGQEFVYKVIEHLNKTTEKWRKETNIKFTLYETQTKNICQRLAKIDKEKFGTIKDVTDKGYYTNILHNEKEEIDIFEKVKQYM